ncbi:hypothetical protein C8J56DRAFT_813645 [Mycena floridula]|nr:hypothetical protein C8J56DRAFT_813645 [Mycena floridula]
MNRGARAHTSLHRRVHRDAKKAVLEDRGLIDLPLSLPAIPLLNPLVTALIGDSRKTATATATATTNTGTAGGGSGSGGSGGSGNPGSGGSGGSSGSDGSGGSADSGGSVSYSSAAPGGGANDSSSPTSTTPSGSSEATGGANNNGGASNSISTSAPPNHTFAVVNVGGQPVDHNESDPSGSTTEYVLTTVYSNGIPIETHTATFVGGNTGNGGNTGAGAGGDGGGETTGGGGSGTDSDPKHGISKGAIAGISVVALFLFAGLFIAALRRRSQSKRSERQKRWWSTTEKRWSDDRATDDATVGSGTISARSSFATTYDRGERSSLVLDFSAQPPLPPMAEIRDAHGPGFLLHPSEPPVVPPQSPIFALVDTSTEERRVSTYSNRSDSTSNESHSQYLAVADPFGNPSDGQISPMFVRPFSPSELFSFPKPPNHVSGEWSAAADDIQPVPALPEAVHNPFSDPAVEQLETVRRPFSPTLHDELAVVVGDHVRVSKVFDDGWALVEKLSGPNEKGKGPALLGLIPVDCLRASGQNLEDLLATKRVSSSSATSVIV